MKKILLLGAFIISSFISTNAQITLPLESYMQEGGYFGLVADVGEVTGTLTSIDFDLVLDDSTFETYANDITIVISTGLTAADQVVLQAGGYSNFGADEHIEFLTGASDAPGTVLTETLTLTTPITMTGSNYKIYIGNGYAGDGNTGTWSGTITLNGLTDSTAGIHENNSIALSIYPNPATDVINVSNADNILVNSIDVIDMNGRTVKAAKFNGVAEAQVNISDLSAGMYLMTVSSDQGTITKKIIKN